MTANPPVQHGFTRIFQGVARILDTPVEIGLPFDAKSGVFNAPLPGKFTALWDTGATNSCIRNEIANQLNLPVIRVTEVSGVGGTYLTKVFLASISLPNTFIIPEIELLGCDDSLSCSMLIGMDVITAGDFLVNTYNGQTTFSFQLPAVEAFSLDKIPRYENALITATPEQAKIGRNELCPCGSGKKYKKCCGV